MNKPKLRLGVLLDSFELHAWAYRALERICESSCAEFSLIILNESEQIYPSGVEKLWQNRHRIVYEIFNKIDEKFFREEPSAFNEKDIRDFLWDVPVVKAKPIHKDEGNFFDPASIDGIRQYRLDILIKFGFGPLQGDILSTAKYGVWSYHHGDIRRIQGGPPGFWEVVESWPETGSVLRMPGGSSKSDQVLDRSWFFTYPFSPARNRHYACWASASYLPRQIELLYRFGKEKYFSKIDNLNREIDFSDQRLYTTPTNFMALKLYARVYGRIIREMYYRIFTLATWYLMFDFSKGTALSFSKFNKIMPPKDRFWADPNVIQHKDKYHIFVEEYIYKTGKGHISVMELNSGGNDVNPVPVLEKEYHLSYPFVFRCGDSYFMVPESAANKTIDLYECVEFPYQWKFKMSLMENVTAVDTTLFFYQGKWWLFTGVAENEGAFPQVELFLFFSNELFINQWIPHPQNPIVSDVKKARPAGKLFNRDGKLFRPSQDCSKTYGFGFNIHEILVLSETEYLEKDVARVRPYWDKKTIATHTFSCEGQLTIVDALMRRRKF